jgi:hypothetical protein
LYPVESMQAMGARAVSEQQQQSLEGAITALAAMAQAFAGVDRYTSSRLAAARADLAQHLAAERWNMWTAAKQAASRRRRFTTRHKSRKVQDHA